MKTFLTLALSATALLALALDLHSQVPAAPDQAAAVPNQGAVLPKSPLEILRTMKAKNQELLEKQAQTLQKLDELEKESVQLKTLGKRT